MISDEVVQRIRRYRSEGVSLREISRATGISVNTIRRYRYLSRYSYKFGPSSGTALLTMTVADYSRQALLRQCCCIEVRESSSGKNAFFPTMYLLHLHLGFRVASGFILFSRLTHLRMPYAVSVRQVSGLPPASFRSRLAADTLALGYVLGATPCTRDFHLLERAHAERTKRPPERFHTLGRSLWCQIRSGINPP